ncbi:MAG: hypothetical protein OXH00_21735 [Candidatus Poribacteria bacterium]|nr:hypothetical protein [Candidatus Poribacteria bacterium]
MKKEKIFYDAVYHRIDSTDSDVFYVEEMENTSDLCRYMDLIELIYLIQDGILEFKQLALFDDPNENRIFLGDETAKDYYEKNEAEIDISFEEFLKNVKSLSTIECLKIYAFCFTLNYDDQYMWDHYTSKHVMVRVKNIKSLARSFKVDNKPNPKIFIEKIEYIDGKNLRQAKAKLNGYFKHPHLTAFIKDEAYEKEREIRAICRVDTIYEGVKNLNPVIASALPPVLKINANPNIFIKEIILSPYLPESNQKVIRDVIKSLSPHLKVSQSRVESTPGLHKKILQEIDFSDAPHPEIKELGTYRQIIINDDGTFEIEMVPEETSAS